MKPGKIAAALVVVAGLGVAALLLLGDEQSPGSPALQRLSSGTPGESPEQTSRRMNESLPMMVDPQTRLDSTAVQADEFHYNYTLLGTVDGAGLEARLTPHLRRVVCGSAQMREFLAPGLTAVYNYRGEDGGSLARIAVSPTHCASG